MANVGIVADDLTGGTTVGALIAREGVPATVFFDPSYVATTPLPDNAAAIVSTDSRPLSAEVAFGRVRDATRTLKEHGARMFAKRIDTTVRGGVGPEVEGMLSALGPEYMAVVVPAMPQSRRVVIEGYSLIDSVLLTRTGVAQDVRTPVKIAVTVLICTQLMNLALVPWLAHAGLALSISLGAWLNAGWLLRGLKKRGSYTPRPGWRPFMLKVALALAVMSALLGWGAESFDWAALQATPWLRIAMVLGMVAGGALLYFGLLMAMGLNIRQVLRPPAENG